MSFGIVLVLGSVRYTTLEVNIYILIYHLIRFPLGMALGSIQLLFSLIFLLIAIRSNQYYIKHLNLLNVISNEEGQLPLFQFTKKVRSRNLSRLLSILYLFLLLLIIAGPLLAIVLFAFRANLASGLTILALKNAVFSYNQILGASVASAIINSIILALSAAILTVTLSLLLTQSIITLERNPKTSRISSIAEFLTIIPLVVSPVTFTLGYLRIIHFGNYQINRMFLMISAHAIITLPFVSRIIIQSARNIPENQLRAARTLGTNNFRIFWRVIIPQIRKSLLLAFSFAVAISLGELGVVMMLGRDYVTIPMAIYRFIGARRLTQGVNMGVVLLLVTFLFFFLTEKLSKQQNKLKA
jgi:thiamine transport system permease protein